jgi:hypothetical protein
MKVAAVALGITGVVVCAQAPSHTITFKPCEQATRKLRVPEEIHVIRMCQGSPELRPALSFLLSEKGIDVYRLEYPIGGNKPRVPQERRYPFTVRALLVYQGEEARAAELKVLMNSPIRWLGGRDVPQGGYQQDWASIVSFKFETAEFVWLSRQNVILKYMGIYAPVGCMTPPPVVPGSRCGSPEIESNEVGEYDNYSPPPLNHDLFLFRVATELVEAWPSEKTP